MVGAVVIEHVAGAMGGIALVALIMALCDVRYSAFQYALLSALALLPRYSLGYPAGWVADHGGWYGYLDRKSTRLNSSHGYISYAVFCLKKKKTNMPTPFSLITCRACSGVLCLGFGLA